jgi:hypothetical protein
MSAYLLKGTNILRITASIRELELLHTSKLKFKLVVGYCLIFSEY